jgi:hypothetical protein
VATGGAAAAAEAGVINMTRKPPKRKTDDRRIPVGVVPDATKIGKLGYKPSQGYGRSHSG